MLQWSTESDAQYQHSPKYASGHVIWEIEKTRSQMIGQAMQNLQDSREYVWQARSESE